MAMYEAVLNFQSPSGVMKNVLHYDVSVESAAVFQEASDLIAGFWLLHLQSRIAPAIGFVSVTWRAEQVGAVGVEYFVPLSPILGDAGDNQYAPQMSLLVLKLNTDGDKPSRGYAYIGGITSEAFDSVGDYAVGVVDSAQTFFESIRDFATVGNPATLRMQIKASNPTAANTSPYTDVDVVRALAVASTQTRRKKGRGS